MTMKRLAYFFTLLGVVFCAEAYGQRTVTDKTTYSYVIPKDESIRQAEISAIKQAKLQMIADHFGTIVGSISTIEMNDINGKGDIRSFTYGETEVKGEWIKDIVPPVIQKKLVNNEFVLQVTVNGMIREIISNTIDFKCKILRNGEDDSFESDSFINGDFLYISMQTPVDGYVAIYLTDGNEVQCLFPYEGLALDNMKVDADTRYVFFSKNQSGNIDPNRVRRMRLGCASTQEHDRIYVIFSTKKFTKAVDFANGNLPRTLKYDEFHSWLSKSRQMDKEMTVKPFDITIRSK